MAGLKLAYLEETSKELHTLMDLWLRVRDALDKAASTDPITKEDEQDFLRVKSDGTKFLRILKNKLTDTATRIRRLDFDYEKMLDILRSSISIAHLRGLMSRGGDGKEKDTKDEDTKRIRAEWHKIFVQMNHVVGAYDFLASDQSVLSRVSKKAGGGLIGGLTEFLRSKGKIILIVIVVAAVIGGVLFYFEVI